MQLRVVGGPSRGVVHLRGAAFALTWLGVAAQASAAAPPAPGSGARPYYSCYSGGHVVKSDHEFVDCQGIQTRTIGAIEERMLNAAEVARQERCERGKAEEMAEWRTRDRENKNLLAKYPDAASLRKQRDADLASARESVARSKAKLAGLEMERKRLALEREFYPQPNTVPERLQRLIEENEALIAAQEQARKRAQDDIARIGANFDLLEKKMTALWAGKVDPQPSIDCSVDRLFGPIPHR